MAQAQTEEEIISRVIRPSTRLYTKVRSDKIWNPYMQMIALIKTVQLTLGPGRTNSRKIIHRIMRTKRSKSRAKMIKSLIHLRILIKLQANHINKSLKGTLLKAVKLDSQASTLLQATLVLSQGAVVTVSPFEARSDTKLRGCSKRKPRLKTCNKMSKALYHPLSLRKIILFLRQATKKKSVNNLR